MYFVKTDAKTVIPCERHRIKIATLGWVRLKEETGKEIETRTAKIISPKGEERRSYFKKLPKTTEQRPKIHQRLANIRSDYQNKIASDLVKAKPSDIAIEDLNVRGLMKNRHLSKAVAQQGFGMYRGLHGNLRLWTVIQTIVS